MENNFRFASASVSDRGLSDKRPVNEDSFLEVNELGLFAVADGVGGAQAGDFASQMAMETLGEAFRNLPENFDAEQALRIAIQHANQSIFTMSSELPQLSTMATTIAALHVNGNIATIAHVGDSRVYRIEPDGTLKRETADHSVVEEEVRAGRMTPEQALVHPSRNVISRALGAEDSVEIDIKTIMVEPGTMFLLCSDGITRHIEDGELEQIFGDEIEPQALCEQMRSICYSRGAEDNLTAVVVRISSTLADSFAAPPATVEPIAASSLSTEPDAPTPSEADALLELDEEETVATARSPFDEPIRDKEPIEHAEEPDADDEAYLLEESIAEADTIETEVEAEPEPETERQFESASIVVPAQAPIEQPPAPTSNTEVSSPFSYALEQDTPVKRGGSAFQSILFLILGGVLGFAALWFWQEYNPPPEVPVLTEMKSNNVPLTSFEELRRNVDAAPERYAAQYAPTPKDSIDHFFLGRALLLTGKEPEAKKQFLLARDRLNELPPESAKSLSNDIAMGLAIVDNPTVAEAFAKEIAAANQPAGAANANSNSNSVANQPIR